MTSSFEVIVIGAGPTGSTTAGLLAKEGVRVLVLEREVFPRFHVGESLLPADLAIFERLGASPASAGFLHKGGAEFFDERIGGRAIYPFSDALPGTPDHAFEVERSKFDHWLAENARRLGADVRYGSRVVTAEADALGVRVSTENESFSARYLVDATGLDALIARRDKTTETIVDFGLAATFTHFESIDPAVDHELCVTDRGNVKIFFVDGGWCWVIPLGGRKFSTGHVTRKKGLQPEWLLERVAESPFLSRIAKGAVRRNRPGIQTSFSFHGKRQHGARFICLGDSACFLDPIFSSGISLGMVGAEHLVDALVPALRDGTEGRPDLADEHARHMSIAYDVFATLIQSFYHSDLLHGLFFAKEQDPILRKGLTSVLAADVWRTDNPFQDMLMSSKRRRRELPPTQVGSGAP